MIPCRAYRPRPITLGGERGYDAADVVEELPTMNVRPQLRQNESGRCSAIDKRTRSHPGSGDSRPVRKRIERAFGWIKTVAGLRDRALTFAAAAYDLVQVSKAIGAMG